jgi:hypothetical protein
METVFEYIATEVAPVDMARVGSRSYTVSLEGLRRRGLVTDGAALTESGEAFWAQKVAAASATPVAPLDTETVGVTVEDPAPVVLVSGVRVRATSGGVRGQVLEVGMRAGVAVVAVAFGMALVWIAAVELVLA